MQEDYENTSGYIEEEEKQTKPKKPNWKNAPTVKDLKNDLISAQSDHDSHVTSIDTWLDNLHVRGGAKLTKRNGKSAIQPKTIRKQSEWRYASLSEPFLATEELFTCAPVTYEDKLAAEQNQLVLNKQFRADVNRTLLIDTYVRAAVDEGTAILRTGWCYQEEEVEIEYPVFSFEEDNSPQTIQALEQIGMMAEQDPESYASLAPEMQQAFAMSMETGVPHIPVLKKMQKEKITRVVHNKPTVEVCDYNDVIIDPTCRGDLSKANFVIYKFIASLSDLEKYGRYFDLDKIVIDNASILSAADSSTNDTTTSFEFQDKPRKQFWVHEYWGNWDIDGSGMTKAIVATFVGDVLIRLEENPFPHKRPPFIVVPYLPVKNSVYGEPDGALIEDNQKIIGAVTRGMIDIMARSANGQQGTRKDALDPINKRKFDKGEDYEFNPQVDPRQAFFMHTYPEIPQSAQFMWNMQQAEAEGITGVKAFTGGLSGDALGSTATGVRGVLDAAAKRELGILRRLAAGIIEVGRHFMSMNGEFLSEEEIIRITNDEFVPVRRDDLSGKVDITLRITTAEEDNIKAQELAFMIQTTSQNMGPQFTQLILSDIAKLRKMPDLAKAIKEFQPPPPDPMQVQIQQMQMQKLALEMEEIRSRTAENQANTAFYNSRRANTDSDTDLKNLEFLEIQQGVRHARDVDKITSQAVAQTKKSVIESQLPKGK
jgi:hypothetical protein